ncbi:MAG: hypothetical protein R2682_10210 [Pyrinomonadaceae bacterium]
MKPAKDTKKGESRGGIFPGIMQSADAKLSCWIQAALKDETRKGGVWTHTLAGSESTGQAVRCGLVTGVDDHPGR